MSILFHLENIKDSLLFCQHMILMQIYNWERENKKVHKLLAETCIDIACKKTIFLTHKIGDFFNNCFYRILKIF